MTTKTKILNAIRRKCKLDCCANDRESWANCDIKDCALWPYRLGKDPKPSKSKQNQGRKHRKKQEEIRKKLIKANTEPILNVHSQ